MPRVETSEETTLRRSDGQASKWRAAFFVPHVIYTAVLASVPSSTDMVAQISFTSGTGTLANVKPDMLLKVGSTAGGIDLGYCRIRKDPIAGTFYIDEQSLIDWGSVPTVYLTVVDDYDLHARHVRIDGTTIYVDYEVAFSNQHTVFAPVPVLGPLVRVLQLIDGTGSVQIGTESDYPSWVFDSTITTYAWSSPSVGVSFSSTSVYNPTLTCTTAGWKVLYCTVTAANGKSRQGVRYVYVWDEDNPPLTLFQAPDVVEDKNNGGVNFNLVFANDISLDDIPDRSLCVLFAEDYYGVGDDQQQICIGAVVDAENIVAIGRAVAESISYDSETKTTSIEIAGYQELMKRIHGFPAGVRFKITPAQWTDMPGLTVDKGLYHLLEFHTTALTIMDFIPTGDTRYTKKTFSAFSSIWEQMQQFAFKQIIANSRVDHLGRLFFEIDPNYTPVADRDYPVVMELTDNDLTGKVELPRDYLHEVGQINLSGVAIDNGGNGSAFFSLAPGHIPARTGGISPEDYLLLEDQTQANELAGLIFGSKNNPYKPMRLKLRANNRLVTCFPNQVITYTIPADKNPRGVAITKNWIPRQRKLSYDGPTGIVEVELVVEAESTPSVAVAGDIPGSSSFSFPPLASLPPLPDIPLFPGGVPAGSDGGPPKVLLHDVGTLGTNGIGLVYTQNFDADDPEFYTVNNGLTTDQYKNINRMFVAPSGAVYVGNLAVYNGSVDRETFIARADYIGAPFVVIDDFDSIAIKLGTTNTNCAVMAMNFNPLAYEEVMYIIGKYGFGGKVVYGSRGVFNVAAGTISVNGIRGRITYGSGFWILTGQNTSDSPRFWKISPTGSVITNAAITNSVAGTNVYHWRVSTTGVTLHAPSTDDNFTRGDNNCASFTTGIGDGLLTGLIDKFDMDPTGLLMMSSTGTSGRRKSSDAGYTWIDVSILPFVGSHWRFAWAGGTGISDSRWIAGYSYLKYSDDFGASWADKQGNLADLNPLFAIDLITVVEY